MELRYTAHVEWSGLITDWQKVGRLRGLHVLRDSVVEERYHYSETQGVHVAFVRVYRLEPPLHLKNEKRYGGCRSWIELPEMEGSVLVSVISDEEHQRRGIARETAQSVGTQIRRWPIRGFAGRSQFRKGSGYRTSCKAALLVSAATRYELRISPRHSWPCTDALERQ